jgi:hypothetical protein
MSKSEVQTGVGLVVPVGVDVGVAVGVAVAVGFVVGFKVAKTTTLETQHVSRFVGAASVFENKNSTEAEAPEMTKLLATQRVEPVSVAVTDPSTNSLIDVVEAASHFQK